MLTRKQHGTDEVAVSDRNTSLVGRKWLRIITHQGASS
jgi:hypothetical protein